MLIFMWIQSPSDFEDSSNFYKKRSHWNLWAAASSRTSLSPACKWIIWMSGEPQWPTWEREANQDQNVEGSYSAHQIFCQDFPLSFHPVNYPVRYWWALTQRRQHVPRLQASAAIGGEDWGGKCWCSILLTIRTTVCSQRQLEELLCCVWTKDGERLDAYVKCKR